MPFSAGERSVLLAVKGVGPTVILRLEQLGYHTLFSLAKADAQHIVAGAAFLAGSTFWKNSPQALAAIHAAIQAARHHKTCGLLAGGAKSCAAPSATALADSKLPNLGPKSMEFLRRAGIASVEQLRELGAVAAYVRIKRTGVPATLNLLWAIEGALTGLTWQEVSRHHRTSLLLALEQLEQGG